MNLSIKNGGYAFLMRLVPTVTNLNDQFITHLMKLILYEKYFKVLKLKRSPYRSICDMFEV